MRGKGEGGVVWSGFWLPLMVPGLAYLVPGKATERLAEPLKGSLVFELKRQEKPVT